jgi:hypothetical protein
MHSNCVRTALCNSGVVGVKITAFTTQLLGNCVEAILLRPGITQCSAGIFCPDSAPLNGKLTRSLQLHFRICVIDEDPIFSRIQYNNCAEAPSKLL